jgi:glycosyltransferase involved in cell wall biosynthesis
MRVASLDPPGELQSGLRADGIPTFSMDARGRAGYPTVLVRLARRLRRERIDVMHAHLFDASVVGLAAATVARTPVRVFSGHHSHEVPLHDRRLFTAVDRFAAVRLADVIVPPSQEMGATFRHHYGAPAECVEVIEHGVDFATFDPGSVDGRGMRAEWGLGDKTVIGAVAKHFWIKNLVALVDGFAAVAARRPDVHLVIMGRGDAEPVRSRVQAQRLADRVSILDPREGVHASEMPQVLAAFDVFVHPALAESFGFVIAEALAMERPVVSTPVGIAHDMIEDGVSGVLASGPSPPELAAALERMLDERPRWPEFGAEGRRRVLTLTPERWVARHEELYTRWLAQRR